MIKKYFFIDESGTPDFYGSGKKLLLGRDGKPDVFGMGMVRTYNRKRLRRKV